MYYKSIYTFLLLFLFSNLYSFSQEETRMLRYPNSSQSEVVFSHAGDLYTVPLTGGLARKITSSAGLELYPRFSPDGLQIAFVGDYDGSTEVYTIPSIGGEPKRITYSVDMANMPERMGPAKNIMQWTSDGQNILYRSRHESWSPLVGKLFQINQNGGLPEQLPLPSGGYSSFSPDGKKLAYNRVFREYRTWKRYSGGQADDIWIYDFETESLDNITNNPTQDIFPMWYENKIYFISDRDFTMNLFSYNLLTRETKKITDFTEFDVKFPSLGKNHIAFENGGYIYLMDLATEQISKLDIYVANDYPYSRTSITNVSENIAGYNISPDGKRGLFSARGDIFTVPARDGNIRNLTNSSGAHDRNPVWSPDGNWIAYVSDKSGENEIYIVKPDGTGEVQLTTNSESYIFELEWSPDSKKILASDKAMTLFYIDVVTKKKTQITRSPYWEFRGNGISWSPDSRWIAYADYDENLFSTIFIFSIESGNAVQVTSEFFNSTSPVFSPGGKYLFFTSDRTFRGSRGAFEYNVTYNQMSNIYAITLQDTTKNPFSDFISDEVGEDEEKARKIDKTKPKPVTIDFTGIKERIFQFPLPASSYYNLTATSNHRLYYVRNEVGKSPTLYYYDAASRKENEVATVSSYRISFDDKFIIFSQGKDYYIEKLTEKVKAGDGKLDLKKMEIMLDRRAEWAQLFNETWRLFKHFFYDPGMHGYDWLAKRQRYEPLLKHVHHRFDLTYLIGEMIGELDVGHAYVSGGDMPKVDAVPIGLLGVDIELDPNSGFYQIKNILEGRNWEEKTRSPLTEPGLDIQPGEYIIAIDGKNMTSDYHPYKALLNKANEFVSIKVNSTATPNGAREYQVKTISSEKGLRYFNWVQNNMRYVDSVTNGRIGYLHLPDMGFGNGLNEFFKYYFPQLRKEGIIIDDRYNGGGNVSSLIIERLQREIAVAKHARNQQVITTTPDAVMSGPMVCLINRNSMSDGDLFPYQFKQRNLGPIIGVRTWGGVIGIRGSQPLMDGSNVNVPEFANFGADGNWVLEDVGMIPDIEIDNHPAKEYKGVDEQLIKGIEVVLELLETDERQKRPVLPPFPNKKLDESR